MEITENKLLATQKRAKSGEFRGQFLLNSVRIARGNGL
jgi:hypothetical protein